MSDLDVLRKIPETLRPFAIPCLMGGESVKEYELLRDLLIDDIAPRSCIEWLLLFDLAEVSWEILRYRRLKVRALELFRVKAVEALLLRLDGAGIHGDMERLKRLTRRNAIEWQSDRTAATDIENRLKHDGFDLLAINAEIYTQARDVIGMFESLTHAAQHRRSALIKEFRSGRFAQDVNIKKSAGYTSCKDLERLVLQRQAPEYSRL
jgi:hypothetical protein